VCWGKTLMENTIRNNNTYFINFIFIGTSNNNVINYKNFGRIIFRCKFFEQNFYDLDVLVARLKILIKTLFFIFYQKSITNDT